MPASGSPAKIRFPKNADIPYAINLFYAFDTGFVCAFSGIDSIRPADRGLLWEHLVLNEMAARIRSRRIAYWRDKQGHEIDFVLLRPGRDPVAVECKWSPESFSPSNLRIFRKTYPRGANYVVGPQKERYRRTLNGLRIEWMGLDEFAAKLEGRFE